MNNDYAFQQAIAQYESIAEMVKNLEKAKSDEAQEKATQAIQEDALEVGIIKQYFILLCTGGPACRIIGNLNEYNEPETAKIQYQDWGTPWTDYSNVASMEDTLLKYARQFYFEGLEATR